MHQANNQLENQLYAFLESYRLLDREFLIALSGGLDSIVLLHIFSKVINKNKLIAVYIDHQLQEQSHSWGEFCYQQATKLGVTCEIYQAEIDTSKASLEGAARKARYAILDKILNKKVLVTAHHQNDQAETVLLNLMRGSGYEGLVGMHEHQVNFKTGHTHIRPFFSIKKQTLKSYADNNSIEWIEDPSNQNTHYDRNFLRHKVIPILKSHWPSFDEVLSRTVTHLRHQHEWNMVYWSQYLNTESSHTLGRKILNNKSLFEKQQILRAWFKQNNVRYPNHDRLNNLIDTMPSHNDQAWRVDWSSYNTNVSVRYYKNNLYLVDENLFKIEVKERQWDFDSALHIPELDMLIDLQELEYQRANVDKHVPCTVCFDIKNNKEKLYLKGAKHGKSVKNFFQENAVAPWLRCFCPLIYQNERLVGIVIPKHFIVRQ